MYNKHYVISVTRYIYINGLNYSYKYIGDDNNEQILDITMKPLGRQII